LRCVPPHVVNQDISHEVDRSRRPRGRFAVARHFGVCVRPHRRPARGSVAERAKIVAGGSVWTCEGSTCSAARQTSRATSVSACQSLVKEVGRVSAFGVERKPYEAEQLSSATLQRPPKPPL
jgi:hypothetical protein